MALLIFLQLDFGFAKTLDDYRSVIHSLTLRSCSDKVHDRLRGDLEVTKVGDCLRFAATVLSPVFLAEFGDLPLHFRVLLLESFTRCILNGQLIRVIPSKSHPFDISKKAVAEDPSQAVSDFTGKRVVLVAEANVQSRTPFELRVLARFRRCHGVH